jgi:hypothetical protein
MADTHRVMIRLSPELYAQLAAHGSSGQPLAAIVRQALSEYLAKQPEQLQQPRAAAEQPGLTLRPREICPGPPLHPWSCLWHHRAEPAPPAESELSSMCQRPQTRATGSHAAAGIRLVQRVERGRYVAVEPRRRNPTSERKL